MRLLLFALAIAALVAPMPAVSAPRDPAPARIAYLTGGDPASRQVWLDAFRAAMAELGFREGRNLTLDIRGAHGRFEALPTLADELLKLKPNVLVASTTPGSLAAKRATTGVPIVFVGVADPVGIGLVTNLARPGGNITGVTSSTAELAGKRLQMLKELLPAAARVAVLYNPDDPNAGLQLGSLDAAAAALGVAIGPLVALREAADLDPGLRAVGEAGAGAAIRLVDPLNAPMRWKIARLAAAHRVPVMFAFREDVVAGGLAAYGTSMIEQYRRAASFVQRILAGAVPGELPVEQPSVFELVINLKTAEALGLAIPPSLLQRADEVIE